MKSMKLVIVDNEKIISPIIEDKDTMLNMFNFLQTLIRKKYIRIYAVKYKKSNGVMTFKVKYLKPDAEHVVLNYHAFI